MAVSINQEEQLRLRKLQPVGPAIPPMGATPLSKPQGMSPLSSIAKVSENRAEAPSSHRHQLEPPKQHYMYGLINAHTRLEKTAAKQADLFEGQVNSDMERIEALAAEKTEKLRRHAEAIRTQKTWGALTTVAQYFMAGTSIVLGATAIVAVPETPWIGVSLITSGVTGLAGKVMKDTGAFDAIAGWFHKSEELKRNLAAKIEMGTFLLSFGLGLAGGVWGYSSGAFAAMNTATKVKKLAEVAGISASLGVSVTRFGSSFVEKRKDHALAALQRIDTETNAIHQDLYRETRDVQNLVDTTTDIGDELKRAISSDTE